MSHPLPIFCEKSVVQNPPANHGKDALQGSTGRSDLAASSEDTNPSVMIGIKSVPRLHLCAYKGDVQGVIDCLNSGWDVNTESEMTNAKKEILQSVTPLLLATQASRSKVIKLLLERGADPKIRARVISTGTTCTPCTMALLSGNVMLYNKMRKIASQMKAQKRQEQQQAAAGEKMAVVAAASMRTSLCGDSSSTVEEQGQEGRGRSGALAAEAAGAPPDCQDIDRDTGSVAGVVKLPSDDEMQESESESDRGSRAAQLDAQRSGSDQGGAAGARGDGCKGEGHSAAVAPCGVRLEAVGSERTSKDVLAIHSLTARESFLVHGAYGKAEEEEDEDDDPYTLPPAPIAAR